MRAENVLSFGFRYRTHIAARQDSAIAYGDLPAAWCALANHIYSLRTCAASGWQFAHLNCPQDQLLSNGDSVAGRFCIQYTCIKLLPTSPEYTHSLPACQLTTHVPPVHVMHIV